MIKDKKLFIRMDEKLYAQLQEYADRMDEGMISTSARKALKEFLEKENNPYNY